MKSYSYMLVWHILLTDDHFLRLLKTIGGVGWREDSYQELIFVYIKFETIMRHRIRNTKTTVVYVTHKFRKV